MMQKPESEELFKMYLLGELPEDDGTRLEEILFANEDYYEQLLAAEDELRYDYGDGLLEPGRRERFEKRFVTSPGDREMLEFASALVSTLRAAAVEPKPVTVEFTAPTTSPLETGEHQVGKWDRLPGATDLVTQSTTTLEPTSVSDSWRQRPQARDRLSRMTRLIPRLRIEKVEEPELVAPEVEQPRAVQPQVEQPEIEQPEAELLEAVQPKVELPEPEHPKVVHPTVILPKVELPKVLQSKAEQPKEILPKADLPTVIEPEGEQPTVELPKVVQSKAEQPRVAQPEAEQPKVVRPKVKLLEADQPDVEVPGPDQSKAEQPKVILPKVVQQKADQPKAEQPKVMLPKIGQQEVEQPKAHQPKAVQPAEDQPELLAQPEVLQTKVVPLKPEQLKVEPKAESPEPGVPQVEHPRVEPAKAEQPYAGTPNLELTKAEEPKVQPSAWELPEWQLPEAEHPQAELLEAEPAGLESPVAGWSAISGWDRLVRVGLGLIAAILIASVVVIVVRTIQYQNQVRDLRRELSLQNGFRAQTEEEKRRARELALDLEVERSRRLMLEEEAARHPKQAAQKVDAPPAEASFILTPGMKKPLIQTGEAERVRLQLNLKRAGDYQTYQANLKTADGRLVWGQAGLRPSRFGPIQVIAVTLLARLVPPGDYHVELKGLAPGGMAEQVDDYYFSVAER